MIDTIVIVADTAAACCDTVVSVAEEVAGGSPAVVEEAFSWGDFFMENWLQLTIAFAAFLKVVVNLTPTEKDNKIFGLIDTLITNLVPDRRKAE